MRQATICKKLFKDGLLRLIRGKIITWLMIRATRRPQCGSFRVKHSQNGNRLDRVPFYGFMANVSRYSAVMFLPRLMDVIFYSGRREECILVCYHFDSASSELTVLASSTIIEDIRVLQKSGLASLVFFYHDFRDDKKKDRHGLISTSLVQLCHQSGSYSDKLTEFYLDHGNGSQQPSDTALLRCLMDVLKLPGQAPVYLIVDALDECPSTTAIPSPRENVLKLVEQLIDSQLSNLRICVTSRPEIDIKALLQPLSFRSISLHDESGQLEDIETYIKSVVNKDPRNRRWKAEDKQLVIDVLTRNADGM